MFNVSAEAGFRVHFGYPFDCAPDDETWLVTVASRHNGELSEYVMESAPLQRQAWFGTRHDADAFIAELANTGRWRAGETWLPAPSDWSP